MYVNRESQNIIADKIEDTANVFRIKLQRLCKDTLLLTLFAYNVGVGRLLGYGKRPKSRLLQKIEAGERNFYQEYVSLCRYKGKVLSGLVKRRQVEFALFYLL